MPLIYGTAAATIPNPCLECGVHCRKGKRFCSDSHREMWLAAKIQRLYPDQVEFVAEQRRKLGITPEAIEWRRKLNAGRTF